VSCVSHHLCLTSIVSLHLRLTSLASLSCTLRTTQHLSGIGTLGSPPPHTSPSSDNLGGDGSASSAEDNSTRNNVIDACRVLVDFESVMVTSVALDTSTVVAAECHSVTLATQRPDGRLRTVLASEEDLRGPIAGVSPPFLRVLVETVTPTASPAAGSYNYRSDHDGLGVGLGASVGVGVGDGWSPNRGPSNRGDVGETTRQSSQGGGGDASGGSDQRSAGAAGGGGSGDFARTFGPSSQGNSGSNRTDTFGRVTGAGADSDTESSPPPRQTIVVLFVESVVAVGSSLLVSWARRTSSLCAEANDARRFAALTSQHASSSSQHSSSRCVRVVKQLTPRNI
jgi:hypothetical protein